MRLVTVGFTAVLAGTFGGCGVAKAPPEAAAKAVQLQVSPARFSTTSQRGGDEVTLSLTVKNTGTNPAPMLIVQLKGLEDVTDDNPLDEGRLRTSKTDLPDATKRAPWFVDDSPEHGSLSASDLYPAGTLAPGQSKTLKFQLLAQTPGKHTIDYQVWSGLSDNAARATSGEGLTGSVSASISQY